MNKRLTKLRPHHQLALVLAGLVLSSPQIWAQATPAPGAATSATDAATLAQYDTDRNGVLDAGERAALERDRAAADSETVVLSPFEVDASQDVGYYAENTLAGSRLNTKVSDLAASITVVTKRQLDDTASYSLNDVFLYEANTEGTGNFTDFNIDSRGAIQDRTAGFQGGAPSLPFGPANANRVRGIGTVDRARDYYPTVGRIEFDSYNTDSFEINRGPNSLLFGLGTPAGIANQSASRARLSGRAGQLGFHLMNEGGWRAHLNYNLPLIEDKFAVFVAAMKQDLGFRREPSYDKTEREYVAVTFKPFERTTLRGNLERYYNENRRPNSVTPRDFVSPWIAAGRPSYDPITRQLSINGVPQATIYDGNVGASQLALQTASGNTLQFDGNNRPVLGIDQGQEIGYWVRQLSATPSQPGVQAQFLGAAVPPTFTADPIFGNANRQATYQAFRLTKSQGPQTQRNLAPAGTAAGLGFQQPGVRDQSIYDWEKINIISGNFGKEKATIANVELEQQIFDNLTLQLGWFTTDFKQHVDYYISQQTGVTLYVDTNTRLLDGSANPNFGRPFIEITQPDAFSHPEENSTGRASLAYTFSFTERDNWLKYLGHGRILGFAQRNQINRKQLRYRPYISGNTQLWNPIPLAGTPPAPDIWAGNTTQNAIERRFYVGNTSGIVTQDPGMYPNGDRGHFLRWFNPTLAGRDPVTNLPGAWVNEQVTVKTGLHFVSSQAKQYIDSQAVALQNYFWEDRIVTTFGWRHDESHSKNSVGLRRLPDGFTVEGDLETFGVPQEVEDDTKTIGVVVKPLSWLSLHYNKSDNFLPAGLNTNYLNEPLPFPSGEGEDYGFGLTLLEDKLYARVNWYEASQDNSRGAFIGQIVSRTATMDDTLFRRWAEIRAGVAQGASSQAVADILQLPNDYGLVPGRLFGQIPTSTTQSIASEGLEITLTYNPQPNWNIKFTAGQQESVFTNVAPEWTSWIAMRRPIWEAAAASGTQPAFLNATGNDLPGNGTIGATQTVRDWFAANVDAVAAVPLATQGRRTADQREWRWNILSTYTFTEGGLKGLGLGGAVRWEDEAAIGYLGQPADPDGVIRRIDVNSPVFSDTETHLDLWLSYRLNSLPFFGDKVKTKIQLNVRNVEENGGLLPVAVNPAGEPIAFRILEPRQWDLGLTFDF